MGDVVTRKCACCKGEIEIDVDDIKGVVYFDKYFYHETCFVEFARKKAENKRCSSKWKDALNDEMCQIKKDAIYNINYCYGRDLLFEHLLNNYDVCAISSYIQMTLNNVVDGKYKGKSRPIPYKEFARCWIDGKNALNKIYEKNCQSGKSMTGDQRIIYDIAVVVGEYPKWQQRKIKLEKTRQEIVNSIVFDDIDMSKIGQGKQVKKNDISDISDDIFTE